jgi:Xaa-Pro aminopeptidase
MCLIGLFGISLNELLNISKYLGLDMRVLKGRIANDNLDINEYLPCITLLTQKLFGVKLYHFESTGGKAALLKNGALQGMEWGCHEMSAHVGRDIDRSANYLQYSCTMKLTLQELEQRRARFIGLMNRLFPDWDTAVLLENANQYYFTGTMQNGILLIRRDGEYLYGVRRSYERARAESPLTEIMPIASYRDIAEKTGGLLGNTYLEGDTMTLAVLERLQKNFQTTSIHFLDTAIRRVRGVKSPYELYWLKQCGEQHRILLEEKVPALLREGMTEAELMGEIIRRLYAMGYHGIMRFNQSQVELTAGQLGFGANSLIPSSFDGPGGGLGSGPASLLAKRGGRKLRARDLVFADVAFSLEGYFTDKTRVYLFGGAVPEQLAEAQQFCLDIISKIAERLKPGEIPSRIYSDITGGLSEKERDCFMGVDNSHRVKFLGHGVGLAIDEYPVIARGFDEPLEENMVIALEPKKGVPGVGMAGVEETFIVTPEGGQCITGGGREIIRVD